MNKHYEAALEWINLNAPADTMEGLNVMLAAQAEATLALAYEQRIANLIAFNYVGGKMHSRTTHINIEERLGLSDPEPLKPAPVEHYRVGPARCNCGFDAYQINGIMIDYSEEFAIHLRRNR